MVSPKLKLAGFVAVLAVQSAVIGGLSLPKLATALKGKRVRLKLALPRDPRSLFRGDYVILRYEINAIPKDLADFDPDAAEVKRVYVSLQESGGYWKAVRCTLEKPDGVFIRGTITDRRRNALRIRYGIESYFVPEGEGLFVEREIRDNRDDVGTEVALSSGGKAVLLKVLIRGEPLEFIR